MPSINERLKLEDLNQELSGLSAEQRIKRILILVENNGVLTTSFGVDSSVMLDIVSKMSPSLPIVYVDHGCWQDTEKQREFVEECRQRFRLNLFTVFPIEKITYSQVYEAYEKGDSETISTLSKIGKKEPLERALRTINPSVWLTGISRDETSERQSLDFLVMKKNNLLKLSPLLDWSQNSKANYINRHSLPTNIFYFDIFKGLDGKKECGLHVDDGSSYAANI